MVSAQTVAELKGAVAKAQEEIKGGKSELAGFARDGLKSIEVGIALLDKVVATAAAKPAKPAEAAKPAQ